MAAIAALIFSALRITSSSDHPTLTSDDIVLLIIASLFDYSVLFNFSSWCLTEPDKDPKDLTFRKCSHPLI